MGIVYDSTLYAGNGETVSLNLSCTPPSGYTFIGYTATSGTLTGTANPYTLTMPNEAVTIQAVLGQPPVPYIDENGVEQQCTFYTVVTDTLDFYDLPAGWYVVNNDFTHNGPALIFGDAHLILCDGAMMNISYGGSGNALNTYGSLTLYGQSEGTGSLSATSNNGKGISVTNLMTINGSTVTASGGDSQGIYATNLTINGSTVTATGSNHGISSIDLTINGSTVTASANDDGGMGISANRLTINSGTVNATGNGLGISIGNASGYVIINGGTVTTNKIYSPRVTLGWSNLNDSITVGSFTYLSTFTVSVKSGQAFCYIGESGETVVISGTLNEAQIEAIGGKTLRPYIEPCVTPFDLEVTDIGATTATLHWTGFQDSYNVGYRTAEPAGEWVVATANTTTLNLTNLEPETEYEWLVQGIDCDGNGGTTEWSEWAFFTTMAGINFAVTGYGQGNGGYYLIASPCGETNPLNVTNLLSGNHDLYAFVPNPSDSLEWRNYATDTFNLIAGKGYLYANADTVTLTFNGTPYSGNGEVALVYDATDERKCWNLVGNPFPYAVYLDREYYVLDADGTGIDPEPIPASVPVPPCTAVFVKAVGVNDRAVFSLTAP